MNSYKVCFCLFHLISVLFFSVLQIIEGCRSSPSLNPTLDVSRTWSSTVTWWCSRSSLRYSDLWTCESVPLAWERLLHSEVTSTERELPHREWSRVFPNCVLQSNVSQPGHKSHVLASYLNKRRKTGGKTIPVPKKSPNWVDSLIDLKRNSAYLFASWSRSHTIYTRKMSFIFQDKRKGVEVLYCNFDHCHVYHPIYTSKSRIIWLYLA